MKRAVEFVYADLGVAIGLVNVRVTDGECEEVVPLNRDAWMAARAEGMRSLLDLVSDIAPLAVELMVREAINDGRDVLIDGRPLDPTSAGLSFFIDIPAVRV